jgi:hypothetical protein
MSIIEIFAFLFICAVGLAGIGGFILFWIGALTALVILMLVIAATEWASAKCADLLPWRRA